MSVSYSVKITGHAPPFRWEVERQIDGGSKACPAGCKGEADSREQAYVDARAAAGAAEWDRVHRETVVVEPLFEFDTRVPPAPPLFEQAPDVLPGIFAP